MTQYDTNRSSAEIEREIEAERSALTDSLEAIQDQFSSERIVQVVSDRVRNDGGEIARSIGNAVKENPMAVALTGIGLAWLMAGSGRSADDDLPSPRRRPVPPVGARSVPLDRPYRSTGENYAPASARSASDRAPYADDDDDAYAAWGRTKARVGDLRRNAKSAGRDVKSSVDDARDAASDKASEIADDLGDSYDEAKHRVRSKGRDMGRSARDLRDRGYARAADLRDRISEGTDDMTAEARERVMAAREAAIRAQHRVEREFDRRSAQARDFIQDQPLIAGAVTLALGAAVGAALPRTRMEDETLGEYRDSLFDEAERVFDEESHKLKAVGAAAVDEARDMAEDAVSDAKSQVPHGKNAVKKAEKTARKAGDRVAKAARDEADKQDLGGSVNS